MRIGQDKLPPAIDLGRAVPDGGICRPRAKGELRERAERAEAEADEMRRRLAKVGVLLREDGEGGGDD